MNGVQGVAGRQVKGEGAAAAEPPGAVGSGGRRAVTVWRSQRQGCLGLGALEGGGRGGGWDWSWGERAEG